jgi:hypothetical protein
MNLEESQAPSPMIAIYEALRAGHPKWYAVWLVVWYRRRPGSALYLCAEDHARQCLLQIQ